MLHRSFRPRHRPQLPPRSPARVVGNAASHHLLWPPLLHRSFRHRRRPLHRSFRHGRRTALKHPVAGKATSQHPPWPLVLHRSFCRHRRPLRRSFRHGGRAALKHPSLVKQHRSSMCSNGALPTSSGAATDNHRTNVVVAVKQRQRLPGLRYGYRRQLQDQRREQG